jgi:hypothetical protein
MKKINVCKKDIKKRIRKQNLPGSPCRSNLECTILHLHGCYAVRLPATDDVVVPVACANLLQQARRCGGQSHTSERGRRRGERDRQERETERRGRERERDKEDRDREERERQRGRERERERDAAAIPGTQR